MNTEYCVSCGKEIPEGSHTCVNCRDQYEKGYYNGYRKAIKKRHGFWKVYEDEYQICATEFTCSECGESFSSSEMTDEEFLQMMKYCCNCGAKMDRERDRK